LHRWAILVVCPLLLLTACGNSRTPPPDPSHAAQPSGFHGVESQGVGLNVPDSWLVQQSSGPLLATVSSGDAVASLWRYPNQTPPPKTAKELQAAEQRLIADARARDPSFQLIRSKTQTIDGAPAIELAAFETVAGQRRRVRSLHVFGPDGEVVLDEYAPPDSFHAIDHDVFSPMKRSLSVPTA
jgi:hypothetical protein